MGQHFESTAWSVIAQAKETDHAAARKAMEVLCQRYWPPLYSFLRHKGYNRDEAEDLTQEFFASLLTRDFLEKVDRNMGRFRSFLLASLENFLLDEHKRRNAAKRGGNISFLPLDFDVGEGDYAFDDAASMSPQAAFDRQWAETLMEGVVLRLEREYRAVGKGPAFEVLKDYLVGTNAQPSYGDAAVKLGKSEGAVKVAVHRLRNRFGALVREEIAQTVVSEDQVQDELGYLIQVMGT